MFCTERSVEPPNNADATVFPELPAGGVRAYDTRCFDRHRAKTSTFCSPERDFRFKFFAEAIDRPLEMLSRIGLSPREVRFVPRGLPDMPKGEPRIKLLGLPAGKTTSCGECSFESKEDPLVIVTLGAKKILAW
eukprot:TRINITY_DN3818_c0_g1_i1.p2 TRINITY_DN3818_c0_g1~~TRINITY_DN3818_c0_g1_i1.p2  ORF type:complete len:134 (+),score=11.17 TRINITY_DN3818_c0_g1_i1:549-950(+)